MRLKRKLKRTTHSVLGSLLLIFSLSFTSKDDEKTFSINVEHFVGDRLLKLDSVIYKNALEQNFTVSKFKYYIGEISLKQENGKSFHSDQYFLINEEEEISKRILLKNVPAANYNSLEFIIGVDSLHNCSGAQSGALDPVNGMFWAWNSGYIFLKLEGNTSSSKSPGNIFEYHIGGYKQPVNCIRKIRLPINLSLKEKKQAQLSLDVDILQILDSQTQLNFERFSSITDFRNAELVANNYRNMFSIRDHEN